MLQAKFNHLVEVTVKQAHYLDRDRGQVKTLSDRKWQVENGSSGVLLGGVQQSTAIPQGMSEDGFVLADQPTPLMFPDRVGRIFGARVTFTGCFPDKRPHRMPV
jgi:hypothetical protein